MIRLKQITNKATTKKIIKSEDR